MSLADSYRHCERLTRSRAHNLYYGIRLLPAEKRRSICAVYAFARHVDDVGDGDLPAPEKQRRLARARTELSVMSTASADPVMAALADTRERFDLDTAPLGDLVAGVEIDVAGPSFESFEELVAYCRLVAGSIGRLCVRIFGATDMAGAEALGDDLGVAMQLTNVLRDVREDQARGRVYLPAEDRRRFGAAEDLGASPDASARLIGHEAARNREWYERGLRLPPLLDARSSACVGAMSGIYRRILTRIEREPAVVLQRRLSLPAWEKGLVAGASLIRRR